MQWIFNAAVIGLLSCLVVSFPAKAQGSITPSSGARGAAMGYTGVIFTDVQSAMSNQAGLAFLKGNAATIFAEQRFLLSDLRSLGAAYAMPTGSGTFGLSLQYFGIAEYNEQRMGLAYGRELLPGTSIGAQINVFSSRIPDYGNTLNLNAEIGLQSQISPQLRLGLHLANPVQTVTREGDRLPTLLRAGLGYEASEKLLLALELEKDIDFPMRGKFGIEYRPAEPVFLRVGGATQPAAATIGAGYLLPGGISFDFAASYHYVLGLTPSFSLNYAKPFKP